VLVGVLHPSAQANERGVRIRTHELVADRERTEALADVLLVIAQSRLDEVEEWLGPLRRPRPRRVLRGDDDRAAQATVRPALPPAQPHAWGRMARAAHLDRAVVLVLAHPSVQTRLAERVGRAERVSGSQRALESLEPGGRGRSYFGCRHARPTKRAIRSPASSIFSRLVA